MAALDIFSLRAPISCCFSLRCMTSPPFLARDPVPEVTQRVPSGTPGPARSRREIKESHSTRCLRPGLLRTASLLMGGRDGGRVEFDPGTHGGAQGDALEVDALRGGRLGPDDGVQDRVHVVLQPLRVEGGLAHGTWTMPAFSARNSTFPAFDSRTARETSAVTV